MSRKFGNVQIMVELQGKIILQGRIELQGRIVLQGRIDQLKVQP